MDLTIVIIELTEAGKLEWVKMPHKEVYYSDTQHFDLAFFNSTKTLVIEQEDGPIYQEKSEYLYTLLNHPKELTQLWKDLASI